MLAMFYSHTRSQLTTWIPRAEVRHALLVGAWSLFGVGAAAIWISQYAPNLPRAWSLHVVSKIIHWLIWGYGVAPLTLALAYRFPLHGRRWRGHLMTLAVASVVITLGYLLLYAVQSTWLYHDTVTWRAYRAVLPNVLFLHFTYYGLAFWAVVALEHGVAYYLGYRDRELRAAQLETQLARSRLDQLRAQLQPHFLFNALNTIGSQVLNDKKQEAYATLLELSGLLRTSLEHGAAGVTTLAAELDFTRQYLKLAQSRFAGRLEVTEAIDRRADAVRVPSLVLQPLVENAVRHGVETTTRRITVTMMVRLCGDDVIVEVGNPGRLDGSQDAPAGTGLRNTRERLKYFYGDRASLHLEAPESGRVVATMKLPARDHEGEAIS